MRYKNKGFTIVEILTVLAVMAILIGVLLPALTTARNAARQAKQRVQFVSIEQAILAWRNDFGEYPPSNWDTTNPDVYCGAQKLAEALLGWDLLGFHPKSVWRADGKNSTGTTLVYDSTSNTNLSQRKPRYLELETANAFKIKDLFIKNAGLFNVGSGAALKTYVLCDEFGRTDVTVGKEIVKAGRPILYYRADPSQQSFDPSNTTIYNYRDNYPVVLTAQANDQVTEPSIVHPLRTPAWLSSEQYKIVDQKVFASTGRYWPHRPDSYILISAGIDGLYGTADDITNFGY
jgi:prepilin-type N-terminal cleavage/methylation domain-containing protein